MKNKDILKRPLLSFFILSYVVFLVLFVVIGISIMLGLPEGITNLLQIVSAWSSTIAIVILFRRINPDINLWSFIKRQFTTRLNLRVLATLITIQTLITTVTISFLTNYTESLHSILSFSSFPPVIFAFFDNLVRGPFGEELGWRGYALNKLQKQYSPLKSSLVIGLLWGGWHTPLWFASGYTGVDLIGYIVLFMLGIVSFSVIVTLFYNFNKNLVIPIVAHQLFNFSLDLIRGDLLDILGYYMLLYFLIAIVLILLNPRQVLYTRKFRER
ncbi:CPBP family intramembrane glutamic endopeptidase [Ornithinibacillus scapharcae]|uniref:CPBP family intramembrane glutamic endopeptidase n=1 Tax=Ornithinibacillus scapharcae TaxID=1147159 RepID=UPI000225AAD1|nr:type II CAAX endopeptidase family protein [Ornithinibacillus scapharcae]